MVALSHVQIHVPVSKHILPLPLLHHPRPHLYLLATQLQCQWHHILHPALSPVQILVSVRGLFFRPHRHSPWWDPRGSHHSPRRATQMTRTRWETTVTAMRARTTTTVLPRGMVSIQWKVSELTMHVLFIRLQWASIVIMRRSYERYTKARLSLSGGPHTPANIPPRLASATCGIVFILYTISSNNKKLLLLLLLIWRIIWKKWMSEEKSQETNVCCAVVLYCTAYFVYLRERD